MRYFGWLLPLICVCAVGSAQAEDTIPTERGKPYTHPRSHIVFPQDVGRLTRGATSRFDKDGADISVEYRGEHWLSANVYVYPKQDETIEQHFKRVKADVVRYHAGAKLVSESKEQVQQGDAKYDFLKAEYTFAKTNEIPFEQRSHAYLLQIGDNWVMYRFTWPDSETDTARKAVAEFILKLALPRPK